MNYRTIIFSGLMAGLVSLMIGVAIVHATERQARKKPILITASILGFGIGSFQDIVRQQKQLRAKDYGESDYYK